MKNILVIQTAFLGDCVLSLPFLDQLLKFEPQAKIKILCTRVGSELFQLALERGLATQSHRIEIIVYDKRGEHKGVFGFLNILKIIKKGQIKIDEVYCLQRSFRSGLLSWLLRSRKRFGFSSGAASYFYTDLAIREWDSGVHEINKNFELLKLSKFEPAWDSTAPSILKSKTGVQIQPYVALSLSSPWPTKRWSSREATNLVKSLVLKGESVVLLGDHASKEFYAPLVEETKSLLLNDMSGKTSLRELVDAIAAAKYLLSGDSAAVHIASDLNTPVVALFGPTIPEFGFAPWRPNSKISALSGLNCRPCNIHGPKSCPLKHHHCMEWLKAEKVYEILEDL